MTAIGRGCGPFADDESRKTGASGIGLSAAQILKNYELTCRPYHCSAEGQPVRVTGGRKERFRLHWLSHGCPVEFHISQGRFPPPGAPGAQQGPGGGHHSATSVSTVSKSRTG